MNLSYNKLHSTSFFDYLTIKGDRKYPNQMYSHVTDERHKMFSYPHEDKSKPIIKSVY